MQHDAPQLIVVEVVVCCPAMVVLVVCVVDVVPNQGRVGVVAAVEREIFGKFGIFRLFCMVIGVPKEKPLMPRFTG